MGKLKIGIIGLGNIARSHLGAYQKCADAEIYAFCDINADRLQAAAKQYGIPAVRCFTKVEDMVALPEIDAVSVCVWNCNHYACTMAALKAGKHVMCEKPLAMNAQQAEEMCAEAKKQGKLLMVGFVRRFINETEMLKKFVDDGMFGELYYAKATYLRRNGCPGGWFADKSRSGGGPVIDIGVHVLDETRYLMGNPNPVSVYAVTYKKLDRSAQWHSRGYHAADSVPGEIEDVEDFAHAVIRYDNGATVCLEASFALNTETETKIELFGTKSGCRTDPLKMYSEMDGQLVDVKFAELQEDSFGDWFAKEIAHFVDCVKTGKPCRNPAEDGVVIMKILDAIYKSAETGHEVLL